MSIEQATSIKQPLKPKVLEIQLYNSYRQFHVELLFLAGHLTVSCSVELFAGQNSTFALS